MLLLLNKNKNKKTFENTSKIQNMENCKGCKVETECYNKDVKES